MNAAVALLLCLFATAFHEVRAQARGPSSSLPKPEVGSGDARDAARVKEMVELDEWLRRQVGRFHTDAVLDLCPSVQCRATIDLRPASGLVDCIGIGTGVGVHCIINLLWRGEQAPYIPSLAPAMTMYGIDPGHLGIRYLHVNSKSIAEGAMGYVNNDTAKFTVPCVNRRPTCRLVIRIRNSQSGETIEMRTETWANYFADMSPTTILTSVLHRARPAR